MIEFSTPHARRGAAQLRQLVEEGLEARRRPDCRCSRARRCGRSGATARRSRRTSRAARCSNPEAHLRPVAVSSWPSARCLLAAFLNSLRLDVLRCPVPLCRACLRDTTASAAPSTLSAVGHSDTGQDTRYGTPPSPQSRPDCHKIFLHPYPRCGRFFAGGATVMPDAEMSALPAFPHPPAATDSESTTIMTACAT